MAQSIKEVMTPNPVTMPSTATVQEAARTMRDKDIGDVIVLEKDTVCGIVTDRDIAVRTVAEGKDAAKEKLGKICSKDLASVSPKDSVDKAVKLMREKAIRRLPVVDGGKAVGMVTIGDLAVDLDGRSALADISNAPPNN